MLASFHFRMFEEHCSMSAGCVDTKRHWAVPWKLRQDGGHHWHLVDCPYPLCRTEPVLREFTGNRVLWVFWNLYSWAEPLLCVCCLLLCVNTPFCRWDKKRTFPSVVSQMMVDSLCFFHSFWRSTKCARTARWEFSQLRVSNRCHSLRCSGTRTKIFSTALTSFAHMFPNVCFHRNGGQQYSNEERFADIFVSLAFTSGSRSCWNGEPYLHTLWWIFVTDLTGKCKLTFNVCFFPFCVCQPDQAISAYTYERTLMMEQRTEMLKEMRKASLKHPDKIMTVSWKKAPIESIIFHFVLKRATHEETFEISFCFWKPDCNFNFSRSR